jgi:hypothetical protein
MLARCVTVRVSETGQQRRVATFTLTFTEAGEDEPAIKRTLDTAALVRSRLGGVLRQAREVFAIGYAVAGQGDFVRRLAVSELSTIGNAMAARWLGIAGAEPRGGGSCRLGRGRRQTRPRRLDAVLAPSRALADAALATDIRAQPVRTDGASDTSRGGSAVTAPGCGACAAVPRQRAALGAGAGRWAWFRSVPRPTAWRWIRSTGTHPR